MTLLLKSKESIGLLLYLETCAVDDGGKVDTRKINDAEFQKMESWKAEGFLHFGRIRSDFLSSSKAYWVELSDNAWEEAHRLRRERAERMLRNRTWKRTEEKD